MTWCGILISGEVEVFVKFIVQIRVWGLGGSEVRELEVEARTENSAQKKAERIMGNREYCVMGVTRAGQ